MDFGLAHLNLLITQQNVAEKGKTTVSVLHDAQYLLNKRLQIWGGIYIH